MAHIHLEIDSKTYESLRARAHRERKSISVLVRKILHEHLGTEASTEGISHGRFSFVSSGASGRKDISVNHDEALAEDFR